MKNSNIFSVPLKMVIEQRGDLEVNYLLGNQTREIPVIIKLATYRALWSLIAAAVSIEHAESTYGKDSQHYVRAISKYNAIFSSTELQDAYYIFDDMKIPADPKSFLHYMSTNISFLYAWKKYNQFGICNTFTFNESTTKELAKLTTECASRLSRAKNIPKGIEGEMLNAYIAGDLVVSQDVITHAVSKIGAIYNQSNNADQFANTITSFLDNALKDRNDNVREKIDQLKSGIINKYNNFTSEKAKMGFLGAILDAIYYVFGAGVTTKFINDISQTTKSHVEALNKSAHDTGIVR